MIEDSWERVHGWHNGFPIQHGGKKQFLLGIGSSSSKVDPNGDVAATPSVGSMHTDDFALIKATDAATL
jgi:hypothetical protein